jgi:hypothetical protein
LATQAKNQTDELTPLQTIWQSHRVALTVLFLGIFAARVPDLLRNPQFWAEDGKIFFRDAMCEGAASIGKAYAGYYHLVPRLVALLAGAFSPVHAPAIYFAASLALVALVLYVVQSPRLQLPYGPWLALCIVLTPDSLETFGNVANVQWFLGIALFAIALMRSSPSRVTSYLETAFVALVGLTGPFALMLMPVFATKLLLNWRDPRERRRTAMLTAALVVTASVQAYAILTNPATPVPDYPRTASTEIPIVFAAAIFLHTLEKLLTFASRAWPGINSLTIHSVGFFGLFEIGVFATIVLFALTKKHFRFERVAALYFCVVSLLAMLYRFDFYVFPIIPAFNAGRYFLIPSLMVCWLVLSCVQEPKVGVAAKIFVGLFLLSAVAGFKRPPLEQHDWPGWVQKMEAGSRPQIPINPKDWLIETDCSVPQ